MFAKKVDKSYQPKTPQKRQELITKYVAGSTPQKIPQVLQKRTKTLKIRLAKVPPAKCRTQQNRPILKEWLQIRDEPNAKSNRFKDSMKTTAKVKRNDMDVENLPNSWKYDRCEAERRLSKLKHYANRIALYEERRKIMDEIEEIQRRNIAGISSPTAESPKINASVLDCKDMTKEAVKRAVYENFQYLNDIVNERIYSKRHEMFKIERRDDLTKDSLSYNVSTVAFTMEQKLCLSTKLNKLFGDNIDYQMKVLLPELCLKIFMDRYNMKYDEAYEYLDEVPVAKN